MKIINITLQKINIKINSIDLNSILIILYKFPKTINFVSK